jgi:hypothetical protein
LNPAKCTFGVKLRKLFGFVISNNGIKVEPGKGHTSYASS